MKLRQLGPNSEVRRGDFAEHLHNTTIPVLATLALIQTPHFQRLDRAGFAHNAGNCEQLIDVGGADAAKARTQLASQLAAIAVKRQSHQSCTHAQLWDHCSALIRDRLHAQLLLGEQQRLIKQGKNLHK